MLRIGKLKRHTIQAYISSYPPKRYTWGSKPTLWLSGEWYFRSNRLQKGALFQPIAFLLCVSLCEHHINENRDVSVIKELAFIFKPNRLAHAIENSGFSKCLYRCDEGHLGSPNCIAPSKTTPTVQKYVEYIRTLVDTFCLLGGGATTQRFAEIHITYERKI